MIYCLYLLQVFGGGNPAVHRAIENYGSAKNAAEHIISGDTTFVPPDKYRNIKASSLSMSQTIAEYCKNNGIDIITIDDRRYPAGLKNIFNPPLLLFVDGDLSCLENALSVSVVGPRNPDSYAVQLAENVCRGLVRSNIVTVSGLARGIDRIAHNCSVGGGKPTVAVLACGITIEYPADTFALRSKIKKCGGAVISELLPDARCAGEYFRLRNRIISGLSKGTCVIGGYNSSGSMLTAAHAFEQDRELFFTIPPDTLSPAYSSVIKYLRDGAHPIYDFYDVINEFYGEYESVIDSTFLDKEKLSYLPKRITAAEKQPEAVTPIRGKPARAENIMEKMTAPVPTAAKEAVPVALSDVPMIKKNVKREEPQRVRFKVRINSDKEKELDYSAHTPSEYLKRRRKKPQEPAASYVEAPSVSTGGTDGKSDTYIPPQFEADSKSAAECEAAPKAKAASAEAPESKAKAAPDLQDTEVVQKAAAEDKPTAVDKESGAEENMSRISSDILGVIARNDGASLDKLLCELNVDFGELTEALADLEIDGAIVCGPGNVYVLG